jgi:hypothetical protein
VKESRKGFRNTQSGNPFNRQQPEDRKPNQIKARRFALARVFERRWTIQGRWRFHLGRHELKIDKLCSQLHLACFVLPEASHVVSDESNGQINDDERPKTTHKRLRLTTTTLPALPPLFKNDERRNETQMTERMSVHRYTALQPPLFG